MHWAGHWARGMAWVLVASQQRIHVVFARAWSTDAIVPRLDEQIVSPDGLIFVQQFTWLDSKV